MIHPLNLVGDWVGIRTNGGIRRVSKRRYRISKNSPFTQHVGKVVRLMGDGEHGNPWDLMCSMARCVVEKDIFRDEPFSLQNTILSALSEIEPVSYHYVE